MALLGSYFAGLESSADLAWLNVITRCANARPVEAHENAVSVESVNPPRAPHSKGGCLYFEGSIGRNAAYHLLGSAFERPERHAAFAISVEGRREATRFTESPHLLVQDDLLVKAVRLGRADTHIHSLNHRPQPGPTKIPWSSPFALHHANGLDRIQSGPEVNIRLIMQPRKCCFDQFTVSYATHERRP